MAFFGVLCLTIKSNTIHTGEFYFNYSLYALFNACLWQFPSIKGGLSSFEPLCLGSKSLQAPLQLVEKDPRYRWVGLKMICEDFNVNVHFCYLGDKVY